MLRLEGVHAYYGESHVLQGIDLAVETGEVVCLLGRNGAGKTTTLRAVMGLTPARRGKILFKDEPIEHMRPNAIARIGIGFVPEDRRIFAGLTVQENLEVAQKPGATERAWPLERIYQTFPMLVDIRDRPGDYLSGGEQQMLAIARALVGEPELLLLDEPNEGLAPVIVQQVGALIDELSKTTTILLTEQKVKFALRHADRGYVIEKGRVRHHATAQEFRDNPEALERLISV
ncbi:MAG TPA: ABC transporter ATP-binding protein [Hyphomicrobiales bacterium]|nr:ABC transporter ATP-binding protein [Hyphomicrobiales bacterium]